MICIMRFNPYEMHLTYYISHGKKPIIKKLEKIVAKDYFNYKLYYSMKLSFKLCFYEEY